MIAKKKKKIRSLRKQRYDVIQSEAWVHMLLSQKQDCMITKYWILKYNMVYNFSSIYMMLLLGINNKHFAWVKKLCQNSISIQSLSVY